MENRDSTEQRKFGYETGGGRISAQGQLLLGRIWKLIAANFWTSICTKDQLL